MSGNHKKVDELFKKMGTMPVVYTIVKIDSNDTRTYKYATIEFTDHPALLFCFHTVTKYKIDNEVIMAEIDDGSKQLNSSRVFYQYPFEFENKYLNKEFI